MAIPEKTQACVSSLKNLRDSHIASQAQRTWAEDQLARLNLWADNLGVFAHGEFSINHRLAKNRQVARLVEQLIEALLGNISAYRGAIVQEPAQQTEKPRIAETGDDTAGSDGEMSFSDMSDEDSIEPEPLKLASEVEDSVGRLLQLAIRVRREGARKTTAEAAKFEPRDENGRPLAVEFEQYINSICQRAFAPRQVRTHADLHQLDSTKGFEADAFLKERAAKCMVDRWRRVSYQRHHASNLADPSQRATTKAETQRPKTKPGAPPLVSRDSVPLQASTVAKDAHVPAASKAVSVASLLPAHVHIDHKIDPHPKTAPTVTTKVRADHLEFPRAPKVRDGLDKFKCPLCGLLCSTSLLEKKKWQQHVMHDLMPYFCLFQNCEQPHTTFETTEDWSNHTKAEHARSSWVCQLCRSLGSSNKLSTFYDENRFRQHLERDHRSIAANELSLVVQMSCQKEAPSYLHCVFCGFIPMAQLDKVESETCQREIINHMAQSHLQSFALDSVPWDVSGGDHADSGRVSGSSATNSKDEDIKQQIMDDPRLEEFELSRAEAEVVKDQKTSGQDTVFQDSNVYTASLDEIARRSSAKDDRSPFDLTGTWCNEQRTDSYESKDPDYLSGLESIATSWASMNKDAPEDAARFEGPHNLDPSRKQDAELPSRPGRKQIIAPLGIGGASRLAEIPQDDESVGSDSDAAEVPTHEESRFLDLVRQGDSEGLAKFLSNCPRSFNYNCTDDKNCNAVNLAVLNSCPALIEVLVDAGSDVNHWSWDFGTSLELAVAQEKGDSINILLRCSANIDDWAPEKGTALQIACCLQNEPLVRFLLDHGATVNKRRDIFFEDIRALQCIELGGEIDDQKKKIVAPLAPSSDDTFVSMTESIEGTALAISALSGDIDIIQLLLERGALADTLVTWSIRGQSAVDDYTPLTVACRAGMSCAVELLLNAGADIDQKDENGETPAQKAVLAKSFETLKVLMRHIPDADERYDYFEGALEPAAASGLTDIVRLLLENGLRPDATDLIERTPLISASSGGHYDTVATLLEFNARVDKPDSEGQSALHHAASSGHTQIVELLLQSGSTVDLQDEDGYTALMSSTENNVEACMLMLLQHGADIHRSDSGGTTALGWAAVGNCSRHIQMLLERGANIEAADNAGRTALTFAAGWNHHEIVQQLIDNGANVNHQSGDRQNTPLLAAARHGSLMAAEMLLDNGAFLEAKNSNGSTALFEASESNETEMLRLLIDRGCSMDGSDNEGNTVLLKTVNAGHIECLQILIEAGATPDPSDHVWELALLLAAKKGNVACLRLLVPKASLDATNGDGTTGLMLAVAEGHLECARLLLDAKVNIDSIDSSGKTALHHAAVHNELECMKLLLDRGAYHSTRDRDGRTPLLLLAAEENVGDAEDCANALIDAGASVNDMDDKGRSALWLGAHEGDISVLRALCSRDDINKDAFDENDQTILIHTAGWAKFFDKTMVLIAAGADIKLQSPSDGRNALAYALSVASWSAAAALMKAGSDLSMIVTATSSSILLRLKLGLDEMMTSDYGSDCRDLVKENLREVATQLGVLKRSRDPLIALKPHQKERLTQWARSARRAVRSRRKRKSVTFATVETSESRAEGSSHSVSEDYWSGSESGSLSDDGSHSQVSGNSSDGTSSPQPGSAPSTIMPPETVAFKSHHRERLAEWAESARQRVRSRRGYESISFATVETTESRARRGSQSGLEDSSDLDSESERSSWHGSRSQSIEPSSNSTTSAQPKPASSTTRPAESSEIE